MDYAETLCIWTYNAIPEPGQTGMQRNLEVTLSLKHRVVHSIYEPMFQDTKAFGVS